MPDLAELTLAIKSEQAEQAAAALNQLERAGRDAERGAQSLTTSFDKTERAATGLERVYNRTRNELTTLTEAQRQQDRQNQLMSANVQLLGTRVAAAAITFERFGLLDLSDLGQQIDRAGAELSQMRTEAEQTGTSLNGLTVSQVTELERELKQVGDAFTELQQRSTGAAAQLEHDAEQVVRAYGAAGEAISSSFESGVDLSASERIAAVEQEANRRRALTDAVELQLVGIGQLGQAEQAELARSRELIQRFQEQHTARLRDEALAQAQAQSSQALGVSIQQLGSRVATAAQDFERLGVTNLSGLGDEIDRAGAQLATMREEIQKAGVSLDGLAAARVSELERQLNAVGDSFSDLEEKSSATALQLQRDAEQIIRAYNIAGQRLSATFEAGVDLSAPERIAAIDQEANRRRALADAIEQQLTSLGRLGQEEQGELARARDLTQRFQEQSKARIVDEEATRAQVQSNQALNTSYISLYQQVKTLALGYVSFISAREAANAVLNFGQAQSSLQGLVAETSRDLDGQADTFGRLREEAEQLGLATQFSANVIQNAYAQMIRDGVAAEDAIEGVRAATQLAEAHAIPLGEATDLVARTMRQFEKDASQATRITDALTNVSIRAQGGVTQLAFGLQLVGPAAKAAGFELEETLATLGALSSIPGRAGRSGGPNAFKDFVEGLVKPSKDAKAAIDEIFGSFEKLDPRTNSLVSILERLRGANLTSAQTTRIFGESAAFTIPILLTQTDRIRDLIKVQQEGTGATERLARANSDNLKGALEELHSAFVTFVGSAQGAAGALRGMVDDASDVIRVLGGLDGAEERASDGALAIAGALRLAFSPIGAGVAAVVALASAWNAYTVAAAAANGATVGLFRLLATHPFTALAVALGAATLALYGYRNATVSAREEQEKLGKSFDTAGVNEFVDGLDRAAEAYRKANAAQDASKQIDALRAAATQLEQQALEFTQLGDEKRIPLVIDGEEKLKDQLAKLESDIGLEIPVELRLETAIEQDAERVRRRVAENLTKAVEAAQGQIKVNLKNLDDFFPVTTQGVGIQSREQVLRELIPTGSFEIGKLEDAKVNQFLGSIQSIADRAKEMLKGGLTVDEREILQGLSQAAADELLSSERLLTISATGPLRALEALQSKVDERQRVVEERKAKRTELEQEQNKDPNALTEAQLDAREQLRDFVVGKREELAILQATAGKTDEAADRYRSLAEAQQLMVASGGATTETQREFRQETERLVETLNTAFKSGKPEDFAAFQSGLDATLVKIEEINKASNAANRQKPATVVLQDNSRFAIDDLVNARILEADAALDQTDATARLSTAVSKERGEFEKSLGVSKTSISAILDLTRAERLLSDTTQLSADSRSDYLGLVSQEIERVRQARTAQAELARERGDERLAIDDVVDSRLAELETYASGERSIADFTATLEKERTARTQALGLSEQEIAALSKLERLERVLAAVVGAGAETRDEAEAAARRELVALRALERAKEESATFQERREGQRQATAQALAQREEENNTLQDALDLLDAKTDLERDEIANAANRRRLTPRDEEVRSLEELQVALEGATSAGRELDRELRQRTNLKAGLIQRVSGAEDQRRQHEEEAALLDARTEAERRAIVVSNLASTERFTAAELEKKTVEELIDLYGQLGDELEEAAAKRATAAAKRDLRDDNALLRLSGEDAEIAGRLRDVPESRRKDASDDIRALVRESRLLRDMQTLGRAVARSWTDAFDQIAFQGAELEEVLGGIFRRITNTALEVAIFRPLEEKMGSLFAGLVPKATESIEDAAGSSGSGVLGEAGSALDESGPALGVAGGELASAGTILLSAAGALSLAAAELAAAGAISGGADLLGLATSAAAAAGNAGNPDADFRGIPLYKALGGAYGTAYAYSRGQKFIYGDEPGMAVPIRAFAMGEQFTYQHPHGIQHDPQLSDADREGATNPRAFARGNPFLNKIVDRATIAPLALFGEAGPEAIVPLRMRGGQTGIAAFGAQGEETLAPLRRGGDGRLGIDAEAFQRNMDRAMEPFAKGDVMERGLPSRFDHAPVTAFATGERFPMQQPIAMASPTPSYAVVQPQNVTNDNSQENDNSKRFIIHFNPVYHVQGSPADTFKRTERQFQQAMQSRFKKLS